jgi:subtilisin family serine protease
MTDSEGGLYPNNAEITIRNATQFNLTGRQGCGVGFALDLLVRDIVGNTAFDYLAVEGATSTGGPWANDGIYAGDLAGMGFDDMSRLDGSGSAFVRFRLHSDLSVQDDGAHVDDVVLSCLTANGEDYNEINGTSMASPHVAGAAALLLAQEPGMNPAQLKNALLKGVDKKSNLTSHVSSGGRLNLNSSLAIAMDHTAPNTTITGKPANRTANTKATFKFRSSEPGSTFQCKHMNGAWRACSSPKVYKGLGTGMHTFRVRAVDMNGNVDPTPAMDTWRVT